MDRQRITTKFQIRGQRKKPTKEIHRKETRSVQTHNRTEGQTGEEKEKNIFTDGKTVKQGYEH